MNRSAGAPLSIWRASAELAPYETTTFRLVWRRYNALAWSSAFLRLAAPNTRMSLPCANAGAATHSAMSAAAIRPRKARRKANRQIRGITSLPFAGDGRYISTNIAFCKGACVVLASRAASISRRLRSRTSKDGQVFQHRDDADDDHDDTRNVLGAAVEGQHIDQIEDENDNQKRDQPTDQNVHT